MNNDDLEELKMFAAVGKMAIAKYMTTGTPSTKEIKDNLGTITTATGLTGEEVWNGYIFLQNKCIEWGSGKKKNVVGFKTDKS